MVTKKHDAQKNRAADAKDSEAWCFEFDEKREQAKPEQDRREAGEVLREFFRPCDFKPHHRIISRAVKLIEQGIEILRNARAKQGQGRSAVGLHRFLRGEREQLAFFLDDRVADLELRIHVDHRRDHLAAITFAFGNRSHARLEITHNFTAHRLVDFRAGREHGCRGTDHALGREVDLIGAGSDQRTGGDRLAVHIGHGFSGKFFQGLEHLEGHLELAAGRFHVEHDGVDLVLDRVLESAAQDEEFGFGDLRADRNDDDLGRSFGRR